MPQQVRSEAGGSSTAQAEPKTLGQPCGDPIPFSHRHTFTGYMSTVVDLFKDGPPGRRILDVPAGAGRVSRALQDLGHDVVCADINHESNDYVYTDMNKRLPFDDDSFDAVICLEGVEHVLDPFHLLGQLIRVCKPGGTIVITTPNIMNMYSRLQFLCTGTFFQFCPAGLPEVPPGVMADRGHISPVSYHRLRYLAAYHGARVVAVAGDRIKRKALLPLYAVAFALGKLWGKRLFFNKRTNAQRTRNTEIFRHINSSPLLLSRSLVLILEKQRQPLRDDPDGETEEQAPAEPQDCLSPPSPPTQGVGIHVLSGTLGSTPSANSQTCDSNAAT